MSHRKPPKHHWARIFTITVAAIAAIAVTVLLISAFTSSKATATANPVHYHSWCEGLNTEPASWTPGTCTQQLPAGITLSGLQDYLLGPSVFRMLVRQIGSAKYWWHINTIRLQITQDRLVGRNGNRFNAWYMYFIKRVVTYALSLKLNVVINDQTELSTGFAQDESLPTKATYSFWHYMMLQYGHNHHVIFDLFNEPRRSTWGQWFDKMQPLVSFIRDNADKNQIWIEGIDWASTLQGVPILQGKNIVYTFHHPAAPNAGEVPNNPGVWYQAFGYLARRGVPVLDGEFTNYVGNYDWVHKPGKAVKAYLSYLQRNHIGMMAWSLVPGSLNATMKYDSFTREPQGDGQIVHAWFSKLHHDDRHNVSLWSASH